MKRSIFPQKMNKENPKEYVTTTITQITEALQLDRQTVFSCLKGLKINRKKDNSL